MLLTGKQFLESIRDGRCVYLGKEKVNDVTSHPAFRNAANTIAMIYDRKRLTENRDVMVCEEKDEEFSSYYLQPKNLNDLEKRFETHRRIASWTYGLIGRSPDIFPSYLTGLAMRPDLFENVGEGFGVNLTNYYHKARSEDLFLAHTVTNPQGAARRGTVNKDSENNSPTLCVTEEDADGVTLNGLKMLGTAAVFCHETWVGNLQPVAPGLEHETITCAVPLNYPGVSIWSRKSYEAHATSEFDMPLSIKYDETDSAVLFENVKIPWERVFIHNSTEMTRAVYMLSPGHALANHQANVRFLEKLKLIVGIAHTLTKSNKTAEIPAVQNQLGELSAKLATLEGLIMGQLYSGEEMVEGFYTVNRRYMYAALHWCTNNYNEIVDLVRELMGGGPIQMPADSNFLEKPEMVEKFESYWSTPEQTGKERMKLLRLAWDLLGSEFAGRHALYEKFYAGPGFVMNGYNYANAPWEELDGLVNHLLSSYD